MNINTNQRSLKEVLFIALDKVLSGEADSEMVEQVCYLSEQMIKDDKNAIEVEKARMFTEIERQERLEKSTLQLVEVIKESDNV